MSRLHVKQQLNARDLTDVFMVFQDTRMFLLTFQHQTVVNCSKHDLMLQERVALQVRTTLETRRMCS